MFVARFVRAFGGGGGRTVAHPLGFLHISRRHQDCDLVPLMFECSSDIKERLLSIIELSTQWLQPQAVLSESPSSGPDGRRTKSLLRACGNSLTCSHYHLQLRCELSVSPFYSICLWSCGSIFLPTRPHTLR